MQTTAATLTPDEMRKQRGALIASRVRITAKRPGLYAVPASTGSGSYLVEQDASGNRTCTCPDYELRRSPCKHAWAVEFQSRTETMSDGTIKTTATMRVTYAQNWSAYNAAQTSEKENAAKFLRALCNGIAETPQIGRGRRQLPMGDRVFAVAMKVYDRMSARRSNTDMNDWHAKGYLSKAPSYNSVIDYMDDPELTPILHSLIVQSAAPLAAVEHNFAADSSGFTTCTYRRWFDEKYGKERSEAKWIKAHVMVGVRTNVVTAINIGVENSADSPQLVPLLSATKEQFNVREVLADKAYLSFANQQAIVDAGAAPFIPFKINSVTETKAHHKGGTPELWKSLFHYFSFRREEFCRHYNQRSNVESTFSGVKRLFGPTLLAKTPVAQENECLAKFLCWNLTCLVHAMFDLGIMPLFWDTVARTVAPVRQDAPEMIELPDARQFIELPDEWTST